MSDPIPAAAVPAPPTPAATPFSRPELLACFTRPGRSLDVVLADRRRLVASVHGGSHLLFLLLLLFACSVAFTVPFAVVDGPSRIVRVATLFLGSALICFPSLQVFGSYLGLRLSPAQNLAIALVIPAAAAMFTLGFFPIYWFLDATMPADSSVSSTTTRTVLLAGSMLLAMSHLNRCLFGDETLRALRASWPLWIGWQALLLWITWRMLNTLELLG